MNELSWTDFEKTDLRAGTIIRVEDFPEARKPAYQIWVDFGEELGIKKNECTGNCFVQQRRTFGQTNYRRGELSTQTNR
jgi:tRNA-binding EMAP/Myf-like protein